MFSRFTNKYKKNIKYYINYIKNRAKWQDIEYVAIVSTGRTGTNFLAGFFSNYTNNMLALHEPCPETLKLGVDYFKGKIEEKKAKAVFIKSHYYIQNELYKKNKQIFFEADGNLRYLIPIIKKYIPNYKIIYIIRNGYDLVRSFASRNIIKNGQRLPKYSFDKYWHILPQEVGDMKIAEKWNNFDIIQKGAWGWNFENRLIVNSLSNDERALVLRFEDIFDPTKNYKGLHDMIDFIDTPIDFTISDITVPLSKPRNISKEFLVPGHEQWSESQQTFFMEVAGELMHEFGYL